MKEPSQEFFERVKDENLLLSAVYCDPQVQQHLIGCHALGLIAKFVTGPLWRKLMKVKHVIHMNEIYQELHKCFQKWSDYASEFVSGNSSFLVDEIEKDCIFDSLVNIELDDEDYITVLKQCLEIIFCSFVVLNERMLGDLLKGGVHDRNDKLFMAETSTVQTANLGVEILECLII